MNPLALCVQVSMGADPHEAIGDAIRLAHAHQRPVVFDWNGVDVFAYPNSTIAEVDRVRLQLLKLQSEREAINRAVGPPPCLPTPTSALPLIYIAGPFRADTPWEIECNVRRAEAHGLYVAKLGGVPLIPHPMYRFFQNALPDAFWLEAGIALLSKCNALDCVVTKEFVSTSKTAAEIAYAESHNIPVFYPDDAAAHRFTLPVWINQWKGIK
jgi:hypothetical protein